MYNYLRRRVLLPKYQDTLLFFILKQNPTRNPVSKYTLKINKDGKGYEEQVDVDTEKETETFRVSKTSPDDEAGEIVYDFKKVITWLRCSCTVLHILQVILMSVDQGLSCAISVTSLDVSVAVNYNVLKNPGHQNW